MKRRFAYNLNNNYKLLEINESFFKGYACFIKLQDIEKPLIVNNGKENICIIPEYQGNGIGSKILRDKIKENKDKNIEIQYFKQNPVGKLYERLGFISNGETEFHYKMIIPRHNK